ncbi:PhoD-like phosphatase-domain-containing protein [Catenaria anguillulae PL171]|uniref:PhoD-like phosphatase-domain-containing protein n=2 Tax=Catenaria anguillulae PL171 TaxID=765915 RepID=A0A1Y2HKP3_9FUNG|nr:PhoD-like phosphatase-domain-containing protein [Catenaria anguillulae PL171]
MHLQRLPLITFLFIAHFGISVRGKPPGDPESVAIAPNTLLENVDANLAFQSPFTNIPQLAVSLNDRHTTTILGQASRNKHVFAANLGPRNVSAAGAANTEEPGGGELTHDRQRFNWFPNPPVTFEHGVASGDPIDDSVIIWTKVTSQAPHSGPVVVQYEVSQDAQFLEQPVFRGTVLTSDDVDYVVKVDVKGLSPRTTYFYRFKSGDAVSPIAETKTLPRETDQVNELNLAIVTCSNMAHGWFHSYDRIAERKEVDVVVGLGDYIYEYDLKSYPSPIKALPATRNPVPAKNIVTLTDYRQRHAQYKTDKALQRMHAVKPFVAIWDDHEFADNTWNDGAPDHDPTRDGPFSQRKFAAARAFHEYMPIRPQNAKDDMYRVYRKFSFGTLADVILMDTRADGRDEQARGNRGTRRLISKDQEAWLYGNLEGSRAEWKVVAQQVLFAPVLQRILGWEIPLTSDTWMGYPAARDGLLNFVNQRRINNTLILTGDFHASYVSNLFADKSKYDKHTGHGSVMTEYVTPSTTSSTPMSDKRWKHKLAAPVLKWFNKGAQWVDLYRHGYVLQTYTRSKVTTRYMMVEDVKSYGGGREYLAAHMEQASGANRITSMEVKDD